MILAEPISGGLLAALILGGAGISAGGNVAGGLLSKPDKGFSSGDLPVTTGIIGLRDPLVNALYLDVLSQLGAPSAGVGTAASPGMTLLNTFIQSPGVDTRAARRAPFALQVLEDLASKATDDSPETLAAIVSEAKTKTEEWWGYVEQALRVGGYANPDELVGEIIRWNKDSATQESALDSVRPDALRGRVDAMREIARLQSDFPSYTASDIDRLSEVDRKRQRDAVHQAAQVGGYNPAAGIAEVERDPGPTARAVAQLGGAQSISGDALRTLMTSLLEPQQQALALGQIGLNTSLANLGMSAQQANMLANNAQQADAAGRSAFGSGVAAAAGGIDDSISSLLFFSKLLEKDAGAPQPGSQYSIPGFGKKQ